MSTIGWVLIGLLTAYEWVLILTAVFSWIQAIKPGWTPKGVLRALIGLLDRITAPLLRPLRRLIKPVSLGNVGLDIAFMILFLLVILAIRLVGWVFL